MGEIDPEYRAQVNAVAAALDDTFNGSRRGKDKTVGFVLLLFPYGVVDNARTNYISNGADRKDIAVLLRAMAARFEGQAEVSGRA